MQLDEAIAFTFDMLRRGHAGNYGYDLYPPVIADAAAAKLHPTDHQIRNKASRELSPIFMDAAWEICCRGYVRPGVKIVLGQAVPDGGYSLTALGREGLNELDEASILVAQPGALSATLMEFGSRFGRGFRQRAAEAIKCRDTQAWLGCCAMAGAAAESILLAIAIAKTRDEDLVLNEYRAASGRTRVLNKIVGQANGNRRNALTTFAGIISLWRDEAAHGRASPISAANANEALRQLLHMCQWVDAEWEALTTGN